MHFTPPSWLSLPGLVLLTRKISRELISPIKAFVFFSCVLGKAIVFPKANEMRFTEGGRVGD